MSILNKLYTKMIKSYIRDLINFDNATDFYSLEELHKDHLVGLGIAATGADIDIVLSSDANSHLMLYLTSYDPDHKIELLNSIKESAQEIFAIHFDFMIKEEIDNKRVQSFIAAERKIYIDPINGEARWL